MFGLADQVGRNDVRIGVLVCKDQAVGRASDHVDADTAKKDTLGFGNKLVARTDENVGLGQPEQAVGHCGHALHAAHGQNLVCATDVRGIDDGRGHTDAGARR